MAQHQVHDRRKQNFFMCDNVIIDQYARQLGPYALAVYMALLRHADRQNNCFPSLKYLADELAMGKDSVIKAIATLKEHKLISVKHRTDKAGDAAPNLYFIREVVGHTDHLVDDTDNRSRPDRQRVVGHADTKKTQFNKTHQEEGNHRDHDGEDPTNPLPHFIDGTWNGTYGECREGAGLHQPGFCPLTVGP
jgi:Helix-turn-helix domain